MDMSESLKPAVVHILLALADEEQHGCAIMQAVREQSPGALRRERARLVALPDAFPRRGAARKA